jgi:hypothetical protein
MVVDFRGLPLEFRYTEPIQPSRIQQILYGSALSRYLKTEVIRETLLKSLETLPHLLIVNDDSFLPVTAATDRAGYETVRLMDTRSAPLKNVGAVEAMSASEFLVQLTPEGNPLRVQLPSTINPALEPVGSPRSLSEKQDEATLVQTICQTPAYALLCEAGHTMDVLEPLSRVEKALGTLCQEAGLTESTLVKI